MDKRCHGFSKILKDELKTALGCTEPASIGFAVRTAASYLSEDVKHISLKCSGNVLKNAKAVTVPNSGGMKGVEAAAVLGSLSKGSGEALEVFSSLNEDDLERAKSLLERDFCTVELADGVPGLYIEAILKGEKNEAIAVVEGCHDRVESVVLNGKKIIDKASSEKFGEYVPECRDCLSMDQIYEYAKDGDISDVKDLIKWQIECNERIADEGLAKEYGSQVGRNLRKYYDFSDVRIRARSKAAAGSDARMSGSSLPVVINSGSGNQGITVSVPVSEFADDMHKSEEEKIRAVILANLVSVHVKKYIGPLSAFCGAVSAASGVSAAIVFLKGGDLSDISQAVSNTLATVGGIVCDGAKASCAAKISSSLECAIFSSELALSSSSFKPHDGLVGKDIEETIKAFGKVGHDGMRETDIEILHIMSEN